MKHIKAVNGKARKIEAFVQSQVEAPGATDPAGRPLPEGHDVVGLEGRPDGPHLPLGCSLIFAPGWEADRTGSTAGLCQPVERDIFDCHLGCYWPAQVPDQLNHAPDWTGKCAAAQKDWRKLDLVFP